MYKRGAAHHHITQTHLTLPPPDINKTVKTTHHKEQPDNVISRHKERRLRHSRTYFRTRITTRHYQPPQAIVHSP